MSAAPKFDLGPDDLTAAHQRLVDSRHGAKQDAIKAIRLIEGRLVEALAGEPLRGLPNLLPEVGARHQQFYALQVRGKFADRPLPYDEAVVVLTREGRLCWATRESDGHLRPAVRAHLVPVEDDELMLEDLQLVAASVERALQAHLARVESTSERYRNVSALARRVSHALGGLRFE